MHNSHSKFNFFLFSAKSAMLSYPFHNFKWMCMKRKEMDSEMDVLVVGRIKKLVESDLNEDVDFQRMFSRPHSAQVHSGLHISSGSVLYGN